MCGKSKFSIDSYKYAGWFSLIVLAMVGVHLTVCGSKDQKYFRMYSVIIGNFGFFPKVCYGFGMCLIVLCVFGIFSFYNKSHGMLVCLTAFLSITAALMFIFGLYLLLSSYIGSVKHRVQQRMSRVHDWKTADLEKKGFFYFQKEHHCCGLYYWQEYKAGGAFTFKNYDNKTLPASCCNTGCFLSKEDLVLHNGRVHLYDRGCLYVAENIVSNRLSLAGAYLLLLSPTLYVSASIFGTYACGVYHTYYFY